MPTTARLSLPVTGLELVGTSGSINIPDQSVTIFNVPIAATVPAGTLELVMEVMNPDGVAAGNMFFIGSNTASETGTKLSQLGRLRVT